MSKTIDKRQSVIDYINDLIMSGEPLSESDVKGFATLARDTNLLYLTKASLLGEVPDPNRMSALNKLQHFVDRQAHLHPNTDVNPLEKMAAIWAEAEGVSA